MHVFLQSFGLFQRGKGYCINFSVPEVKILILLSYFIIFGTVTLVNFSVKINLTNSFFNDLFRYFACQLGGFDPMCEDIRRQFERHLKPKLNSTTFFLTGLTTWVYLLFTIRGITQNVKRLVHRMTLHCCASAKLSPFISKSDKSVKSSDVPFEP